MGAWDRVKRFFKRGPEPTKPGKHRPGPGRKPFKPQDYAPPPPTPPTPPTPPKPPRRRRNVMFGGVAERNELLHSDTPPGGINALAAATSLYGAQTILDEELESLRAFQTGHHDPGSDRFVNQIARLESLGAMNVRWHWWTDRKGRNTYRVATDFVEWFFYHSSRTL